MTATQDAETRLAVAKLAVASARYQDARTELADSRHAFWTAVEEHSAVIQKSLPELVMAVVRAAPDQTIVVSDLMDSATYVEGTQQVYVLTTMWDLVKEGRLTYGADAKVRLA